MKQTLLLLLLPGLLTAQTKSIKSAKGTAKNKTVVAKAKPAAAFDGFIINGEVTGYADGTNVSLINPQTNAPIAETVIKASKFQLKGKIASPDICLLVFNRMAPYTNIFLDNSNITVKGSSAAPDKLTVTGSPAHKDFVDFTTTMEPYGSVFVQNAPYDAASFSKAAAASFDFAVKHMSSYINPFAIYRYYQATDNALKADSLYNLLAPEVKATSMSAALGNVLSQAKQNATGYILPDFTQADTSGVPVSLSSFRGKYVLVDFWASWCGPCRMENPNVVAAFNRFKDKNFTVLGVSLDRPGKKDDWLKAIHDDGLTWTHVSDLQFWSNAVAQQFQIQSIPQNFLVDPEGKLIGRNLRGAALERKLEEVLK